MEDFKNRLLEFISRQYGLSIRAFEEKCNITNGTIGSIKVKGPSADVLSKISSTCPELNLNWLVTGEGNMLNAGTTNITAKASSGSSANVNIGNQTTDTESLAVLRKEIEMLRAQLADKDEQIQFLKSLITK